MIKLRKVLGALCLGVVLSLNVGTVCLADEGGALSNPIGDIGSDVPVSVVDSSGNPVAHYNFLVPYSVTCEDIGGQAIELSATGKYSSHMSKVNNGAWKTHIEGKKAGQQFLVEWNPLTLNRDDISWLKNGFWKVGVGYQLKTDDNTGVCYVESNGLKAYVAAIPEAFFNFRPSDGGNFFEFDSLNSQGILFDIILKDGTIIHFVTGDAASSEHTNGGDSTGATGQDGVQIKNAPLNTGYEAYKNLFHAFTSFHSFELWGVNNSCHKQFVSYYKIDSNPVVAVRMYGTSLKNNDFKVADGMGELSVKGGVPSLVGGNSLTGQTPGYTKGYYDEMDLAAWSYLSGESVIEFKDRSNLDQSDLTGLHNWESNIENNKFSLIKLIRYCISFIGIMFITWGSFFYLGYWFDRVNPILPIRVVNMMSFGKLEVTPDESECTFKLSDIGKGKLKTINHWVAIEIALMAIGFGTLLVSGWAYRLIAMLISFVTSRLG